MLTLNYYVEITATPQRVWRVLTDVELYKRWAQAFSPQSQFEGEWEEGSDITFFDPDMGGTRAVIDSVQPLHRLEFHHVAIFNPDNRQQLDADIAAKWIGSREIYQIDTEANACCSTSPFTLTVTLCRCSTMGGKKRCH